MALVSNINCGGLQHRVCVKKKMATTLVRRTRMHADMRPWECWSFSPCSIHIHVLKEVGITQRIHMRFKFSSFVLVCAAVPVIPEREKDFALARGFFFVFVCL